MPATRQEGDLYVNGNLNAKTLTIPDGTIIDADVAANAGISPSKMGHRFKAGYSQGNVTATSETRTLAICYAATGSVIAIRAGSIVANLTTATVSIDIKKNGSSILTAPIVLDNANTARVVEAAAIASAGMVAGDWIDAVFTAAASGGTLATGVFAEVIYEEASA